MTAEQRMRDITKRERAKRKAEMVEKQKTDPKQGEVGFYFTVRQSGGKSNRRYYVCFRVDENYKAQWLGRQGGVKPNKYTLERVNAIDWSKPVI